jgi:hypothetical protein
MAVVVGLHQQGIGSFDVRGRERDYVDAGKDDGKGVRMERADRSADFGYHTMRRSDMEMATCQLRGSLERKVMALTEVEKTQAELRRAMEAKDKELMKVWADLEAERRNRNNVE